MPHYTKQSGYNSDYTKEPVTTITVRKTGIFYYGTISLNGMVLFTSANHEYIHLAKDECINYCNNRAYDYEYLGVLG